ncbi:transposase [uncultured Ruegeria sp.]|uniref:transposase n=1 Tax=uncultured Ruegeria sp. TaxID=259304 RepID=UPI00345B652D
MRVVFRLALRQTQGFIRSIAKLLGLDLVVPDFSTLSRRSKRLKITQHRCALDKPITLIVDSTGLKMHDGNGWCEEMPTTRPSHCGRCSRHVSGRLLLKLTNSGLY